MQQNAAMCGNLFLKHAADSLHLGPVAGTDIFTEFDRADAALDPHRRSRLLRGDWASFALSVFRTCFSQDDKQVECERMHLRVDGIRRDFIDAERPVPHRRWSDPMPPVA